MSITLNLQREAMSDQPVDYALRLSELLTPDELQDLVEALEAVNFTRNGFGSVLIIIKRQRIEQLEITSTVRPSLGR